MRMINTLKIFLCLSYCCTQGKCFALAMALPTDNAFKDISSSDAKFGGNDD